MSRTREKVELLDTKPLPGTVEALRCVEGLVLPRRMDVEDMHFWLRDGQVIENLRAAVDANSPIHTGSYGDEPSPNGFRGIKSGRTLILEGRRNTASGATDYSYLWHMSEFSGMDVSLTRNGAVFNEDELRYAETSAGERIRGNPRVVGMVALEAAADLAAALEARQRVKEKMDKAILLTSMRLHGVFMEIAEEQGLIPKQ